MSVVNPVRWASWGWILFSLSLTHKCLRGCVLCSYHSCSVLCCVAVLWCAMMLFVLLMLHCMTLITALRESSRTTGPQDGEWRSRFIIECEWTAQPPSEIHWTSVLLYWTDLMKWIKQMNKYECVKASATWRTVRVYWTSERCDEPEAFRQ